jgi:hypothetical protein
MKLGYNKHAWDRPNLFIITGIRYNQVGYDSKHGFGTEKMKKICL